MNTDDLLGILPLISAGLWVAVAYIPIVRYPFGSPFRLSLTAAFLLLALWSLLDWAFFATSDATLALLLSKSRNTSMTLAMFAFLVSAKWIHRGHSRYDYLLVVPLVGSLALVWGGMTTGVIFTPSGPQVMRNQVLYAVWATLSVAYLLSAVGLFAALFAARRELPGRLRTRFFGGGIGLSAFSALWLALNIYTSLAQTAGVEWLSSVLAVPAAAILFAFAPLSPEEIGQVFLGVAGVERRVSALYVFYKTGEPLVAVGSSRNLPIEAEQLEGVLDVVGNFVETSMKGHRGYAVTALRFDRLGILAVRGQYVILAALYDGPVYDILRPEMLRSLRAFEDRRWQDLATWEGASQVAEEVADDLAKLLAHPGNAPPVAPASVAVKSAALPTDSLGSRMH